jgi:hypothetical protein
VIYAINLTGRAQRHQAWRSFHAALHPTVWVLH